MQSMRHCQATPGLEISNLQEFGEFLQADWASFPDSVLTISQLVAEDDRVAMWATYEDVTRHRGNFQNRRWQDRRDLGYVG